MRIFRFNNLNEEIRNLMKLELNMDQNNNNIYFSKRFTIDNNKYINMLQTAIETGNNQTLAMMIQNYLERTEQSIFTDASETLADGEFNKYYMRAISIDAINKSKQVQVYRARNVIEPRQISEIIIGKVLNPIEVLNYLRTSISQRDKTSSLKTLGVPNSGLSIQLFTSN